MPSPRLFLYRFSPLRCGEGTLLVAPSAWELRYQDRNHGQNLPSSQFLDGKAADSKV